ncbi:MAG: hypothetical protein Q8R82_18225, partial [Hyphomonadaceae bacterium]|nr:hypothetical protein [Hyphomonadaceae bacterium]
GQPDLTVTITPEGGKLWVEAAPFVARQRFNVVSETQAFAINGPVLGYTTDKDGKPQSIEVARGIFAIRKS